jgi:ectoine hydroxylase-related dioxygenase (phytanoyl-CoA dioxygenase family)
MQNWREKYEKKGYYFPIKAMSANDAATYKARLEAAELQANGDAANLKLIQSQPATVLDFADEIARLPSIVNPVTEILGKDVLLWNATFFIKEPRSSSFISWHQDLKYWGLEDSHEVTAWLALSNVTTATGCMKFIPGTHTQDIAEHIDTFADDNLLSRGQEIAVEIDEDDAVHVELQPGEISLHHGKLFHGSSPNQTDERRIGLALRYISTNMDQSADVKPFAKLVSGTDAYGHYQLLSPPSGVLEEADIATAYDNIQIQEQFLFAGTDLER